ncbi:MAG TPA: DJ-1/PfpI family protein [Conexibacter sp.]|jgi:transcriptional regulator GlxA family with amidase domain|nr:DJ-1/PfpI family protein [Conexibacter sp.]
MQIDILIFDGFDDLDALGPNELLRHASRAGAPFEVALATLDGAERVVTALGTTLIPDRKLADRPDLVLVPGGGLLDGSPTGVLAEIERGAIPAALARLHGDGVALASVCTGALLLGAAGLLAGRPATTNLLALDRLRETGAEVIDARVVDDGDIITAQGVTAGMDLALWLVERERGADVAAALARGVEYEPNGEVWRRESAPA